MTLDNNNISYDKISKMLVLAIILATVAFLNVFHFTTLLHHKSQPAIAPSKQIEPYFYIAFEDKSTNKTPIFVSDEHAHLKLIEYLKSQNEQTIDVADCTQSSLNDRQYHDADIKTLSCQDIGDNFHLQGILLVVVPSIQNFQNAGVIKMAQKFRLTPHVRLIGEKI